MGNAKDNQKWVSNKIAEKLSKQEQASLKKEAAEIAKARQEMKKL